MRLTPAADTGHWKRPPVAAIFMAAVTIAHLKPKVMLDKKENLPPSPPPDEGTPHRPPESPDFAASDDALPDAETIYEEDPFDTPGYEPPPDGEGP